MEQHGFQNESKAVKLNADIVQNAPHHHDALKQVNEPRQKA